MDVAAAVRMRDIAGLDVMSVATGEGEAVNDITSVVNALYAVMLPDMGRMTPWRFGRRLRSIPAAELRVMLAEAIEGFFAAPGPDREEESSGREYTAAELWREVWRMAGTVMINPDDRTFGELAVMVDGQRRRDWPMNAVLRATIANSNAAGSGRAVDPAELDPSGMLKEACAGSSGARELTPDGLRSFAAMFVGRQ